MRSWWAVAMVVACGESSRAAPPADGARVDLDGDGYVAAAAGGNDCDDANLGVHPGADDLYCEGVDNDCYHGDGPDLDGDLATVCAGDCEDQNNLVAPGLPELCDGLDSDCNGTVDDADVDGDGVSACFSPIPLAIIPGFREATPIGAALLTVDLNGDGASELVATEVQGADLPARAWLFPGGPGCLLCEASQVDVGGLSVRSVSPGGDLQGDGLEELIVVSEVRRGAHDLAVHILAGTSPGWLAPWFVWDEVGHAVGAAPLGDRSGDGVGEVALFVSDNGHPVLGELGQTVTAVPSGGLAVGAEALLRSADLTGDGLPELVFAQPCDGPYPLLLMPAWPPEANPPQLECGSDKELTAFNPVGDVDGDGFEDVAIATHHRDVFGVLAPAVGLLMGGATAETWGFQSIPFGEDVWVRAVAGLPGADPLLLVALQIGHVDGPLETVLQAWEVRAGGDAPRLVQALPLGQRAASSAVSVASGDLDGDGWPEIVVGEAAPDASGWPDRAGRLTVVSPRRDCDDTDAGVGACAVGAR